MQVAWAQAEDAPKKAVLRPGFDNRGKSASAFGAVMAAGGSAFPSGAFVTLVLRWKFGWLRRRTA